MENFSDSFFENENGYFIFLRNGSMLKLACSRYYRDLNGDYHFMVSDTEDEVGFFKSEMIVGLAKFSQGAGLE